MNSISVPFLSTIPWKFRDEEIYTTQQLNNDNGGRNNKTAILFRIRIKEVEDQTERISWNIPHETRLLF